MRILIFFFCLSFSLSSYAPVYVEKIGGKGDPKGIKVEAGAKASEPPVKATIDLLNQEYAVQKAAEEERKLEMRGREDPRPADEFCCEEDRMQREGPDITVSDSSLNVLRVASGQAGAASSSVPTGPAKAPADSGADSAEE